MYNVKKYFVKADNALKMLVKFSAVLSSGIIFIMMFIISADVVMRYLFNRPIQGVYDIAEFSLVGVVFLSLAYIQSVRGHIFMEIATSWMPVKGQMALDIFNYILAILFFAIIFWQSGKIAWTAWVIHDHTMGLVMLPLWPAKSIVPYGSGLICLQLVSNLIQEIFLLSRPALNGPRGER